MDFRILGPLAVLDDDGRQIDLGPYKQRSLLAVLLLDANRVVSIDRIVEALWGEEASGKESALYVHVSRLRSALEPDRVDGAKSGPVVTRDSGYLLDVDATAIDAHRFERLASEGRELLATDPQAAADRLGEALALWRGPALDDFTYEDFARSEVERLTELRLNAIEDRLDADLAMGRSGELVSELEILVNDHPLRGRPVGQLMLALHRSSRQAEALRVFERFRRELAEELGIDPPAELRRLEEQILVQDEQLQPRSRLGPGTSVAEAVNPFKGLRPFLEGDSDDFYGRDRLVADMVRTLGSGQQLLGVVGPSGSGKSSVVRAGLVPALRKGAIPGSDQWLIAQMMPGAYPFAEAESAILRSTLDAPASLAEQFGEDDAGLLRAAMRVLPDDSARLLLVIDQFEELFTLVDDEAVRRRFLDNLVTAVSDHRGRVNVVLTLRADLYDRPLKHPEFGSLLSGNIVNVTPLSAEELEAAALRPAEKYGVSLEPGLLSQLIADLGDEPGSLPLFQYTLTELFDRRIDNELMLSTYRAMGGVNGALGRRADALFGELGDTEQEAARQLFFRLVAVTGEGERSRRRVEAGEIIALGADVVAMQTVIERFGAHRLLAFDRDPGSGSPTIEVAHEALLDSWDQYGGWIDQYEEDLRRGASLRTAVEEWERSGRDPGYLLTGARLIEFERWRAVSPVDLTELEVRFLDAGSERREAEEEAEARRQRREVRRLRVALVMVIGGLIMALAAGLFAFVQRNRADQATAESETRRLGFEAIARADTDRRLALLMASEAYAREPGPVTLGALQQVMLETGPVLGYVGHPDHQYLAVELAGPTGNLVAVHRDGIEIWSTATFELVDSVDVGVRSDLGDREPTSAPAAAFDVSPDGRWVAVGTDPVGITLFDTENGQIHEFQPAESVSSIAFAHDSGRLAAGTTSGEVFIVDVQDRSILESIGAGTGPVLALSFSPDDSALVSGSGEWARVWAADSWELSQQWAVMVDVPFEGSLPTPIHRVHIRPSAPSTAQIGTRNSLLAYDLETGEKVAEAWLPTDRSDSFVTLTGSDLLPDGGLLIGLSDGRLRVLDEGGAVSATIDTQLVFPGGVDASPDGSLVAGAGHGGVVVVAHDGRRLLADVVEAGPAREFLSISANGDLVAQSDLSGGPASVYQRVDGEYVPLPIDDVLTNSATEVYAVSDDLTYFMAFRFDPDKEEDLGVRLTLHDAPSGDLAFDGTALGVGWSFSPDGRLHATNRVGTVVVWDLESEEEVAVLTELEGEYMIRSASFSADGSLLFATSQDGRYHMWDTTTWESVVVPIDLGDIPVAGFSPDGRHLATVGVDGTITLRHPASFEEVRVLTGAGPPQALGGFLSWSGDGRALVTRFENLGRLWDVESGIQIGEPFPNDPGRIPGAATGSVPQLVTGVGDEVWVWNLDTDTWPEIACRAAGRNLTEDEWEAFGPTDTPYGPTCPQYP